MEVFSRLRISSIFVVSIVLCLEIHSGYSGPAGTLHRHKNLTKRLFKFKVKFWTEKYSLDPGAANHLKLNKFQIPVYKQEGSDAVLICDFSTGQDTLYFVKWYKGRREFFRFVPQSTPQIRTFPELGVHVNEARSNETHMFLENLTIQSTGTYSCEVIVEPIHKSKVLTGTMTVGSK